MAMHPKLFISGGISDVVENTVEFDEKGFSESPETPRFGSKMVAVHFGQILRILIYCGFEYMTYALLAAWYIPLGPQNQPAISS